MRLQPVTQAEQHAEKTGGQGCQQNSNTSGIPGGRHKHEDADHDERMRYILENRTAEHIRVQRHVL